MKKLLASVLTLLAVSAAVTAATAAVFNDKDQVLGNTVTSVKLTIDAREVVNKPLNDLLLLPGEWGDPGTVDLYNDGNVAQRQFMYIENISGDLCDYVQLKLGYSWVDPNDFDVTFGTYNLSDLEGEANKMYVGRSDPVGANITTRLVQQPYLLVATPNEVQNSTCTWDEVFLAEQPL
ncbi:hypothetical protein C4561_00240 [candidate division WWE3 bacterium]|jgi:type 1 fimbria pilin|uniref:SipW-cognate class signal peptide n=1 Tax=candidate division WWE3 bacterium TaxID=2053526 RepID=A0A3A4ZN17_UNCKA|nr:MAG: hypothetical protein C4561_00240 [candidate division WWE3 bacterium]